MMALLKRYSLLLLLTLLVGSCRTAEEIAASKAAKAERDRREKAAQEEQARQKRLKDLADMRKEFPCDTSTRVRVETRLVKGDSIPCPPGGKGKCPDVEVRDSTITNTIVDSSLAKTYKDSLDAARYQIELRDQHIEDSKKDYAKLQVAHAKAVERGDVKEAEARKWKRRCWIERGVAAGVVILWLLLSGKLSWISSLFKLFRR